MVKRICEQCGKEFETQKCYLKRGGGRFCSASCSTTYRNLHNNPSWNEETRKKISENHADVSGINNPMYGKSGKLSPNYKDGRTKSKLCSKTPHGILMYANKEKRECKICGSTEKLEIHHIDGDHFNNVIENLVYLCHDCHRTKAHTYLRNEKGQYIGVITHDIREVV